MVNGGDRTEGQPNTTKLRGAWPRTPERDNGLNQIEFPVGKDQETPAEKSKKSQERRVEIERMKDVLKNIEFILEMRTRLTQLMDLNQIDLVVRTLEQMRRVLSKQQMSDNDFEAFIQHLLRYYEHNTHDTSVGNTSLVRRKLTELFRPVFEFSPVASR
jgi:hypothetical protein